MTIQSNASDADPSRPRTIPDQSRTDEKYLALDGSFYAQDQLSEDLLDVGHFFPEPPTTDKKHTVYNFEVEGTHTYIAGGFRVHNTSALSFYNLDTDGNLTQVLDLDQDGRIDYTKSISDDGRSVVETWTTESVDGNTTEVTKKLTYTSDSEVYFFTAYHEEWTDPDTGEVIHIGDRKIDFSKTNLFGDQVDDSLARVLQPYLYKAFGLDSPFEKIFAGSFLTAVAENALQIGLNSAHSLLVVPGTGLTDIEQIADNALSDFNINWQQAGADSASGLITAAIMGEIFGAQELDGIGPELAYSILSTGVDVLVDQGFDFVFDAAGIFPEYKPSSFPTDPLSLVLTSITKSSLPPLETEDGALAAEIAKVLFAAFFPALGPLGGALGAIAGQLVGMLFDNWFGKEAYADLKYDSELGTFDIRLLRDRNAGDNAIAEAIGVAVSDQFQELTQALQSQSNNFGQLGDITVGYERSKFKDKNGIKHDDPSEAIYSTLLGVLAALDVKDGDLKVLRALDLANLSTVTTGKTAQEAFTYLFGQMKIAADYQVYLENSEAINSIISQNTNPGLAKAWLATLFQAQEMGLADGYTASGDAADNLLLSGDGDDSIDGGAGDDVVRTYGGQDTLVGGIGDDTLEGGDGADTINGGAGFDIASYQGANQGVVVDLTTGAGTSGDALGDQLAGIEGLSGSHYADLLTGDAGDNSLIGRGGDDTLIGGAGDDTLEGDFLPAQGPRTEIGNDLLLGWAGNDSLSGGLGDDTLVGGTGDDTLDGGNGLDVASYRDSASAVDISLLNDTRVGVDAANDTYVSIEGLEGSDFDDTLEGDHADNVIIGGKGDDFLDGQKGGDVYKYAFGDGNDIILERSYVGSAADTLRFVDVASTDLVLTKIGQDLILGLSDGASITLQSHFYSADAGIEQIEFADGVVWDARGIINQMYSDMKAAGSVVGVTRDDEFHHALGDGSYSIINGDIFSNWDKLIFDDVNLDQVGFEKAVGSNDVLLHLSNGETITLVRQTEFDYATEAFQFADGHSIDRTMLTEIIATPGIQYVSLIAGSSGDETLSGTTGQDYFDSSLGDDTLTGGAGNDVYLVRQSNGNDTVNEIGSEGSDRIVFAQGISMVDMSVHLTDSDGNGLQDLIIDFRYGGGQVKITDVFDPATNTETGAIEIFQLHGQAPMSYAEFVAAAAVEGTSGDDDLSGTTGNDFYAPVQGSDTLQGGDGHDRYMVHQDSGHALVKETWGHDEYIFGPGIALSDLLVTKSDVDGDGRLDINISVVTGTGSLTISQANHDLHDTFTFFDGTSYNGAEFYKLTYYAGTGGDEDIFGTDMDDTFAASAGNDRLFGDWGDDIYHVGVANGDDLIIEAGWGSNDRILFDAGITLRDLVVTSPDQDGNGAHDLRIAFRTGEGSISISGSQWDHFNAAPDLYVEWYEFADGTKYSRAEFLELTLYSGSRSDEEIRGSHVEDVFWSSEGDDTLIGGWGGDTYNVDRRKGDDLIVESHNWNSAGTDKIVFAPRINQGNLRFDRVGDNKTDMKISFNNGTGSVTIQNGFANLNDPLGNIEKLELADGSVISKGDFTNGTGSNELLTGDAGNNILLAHEGDDTLIGGAGADNLFGGAGEDLADYQSSGAAVNVSLQNGTGSGGDAEGDSLSGIEHLNGTDLNDTLEGDWNTNHLQGGLGNDLLSGLSGQDLLEGAAGNDTILGGAGNDILIGATGDDSLSGGADDDDINGDLGNDTLLGDGGNDTLSAGDGNDSLLGGDGDDLLSGGAGADTIDGGAGSADRIDYSSSTGALTIDLAAGTASGGHAQGDVISNVEQVIGTGLADNIAGNGASNELFGGFGDDTLKGRAGNDTLYGADGADIYQYALGDGSDDIVDTGSAGTDTLVLTGILSSGVSVVRGDSATVWTNNDPNLQPTALDRTSVTDMQLHLNDGSIIALKDQLNATGSQGVETITFDDGTVWAAQTLRDKVVQSMKASGYVIGSELAETYRHTAGDGSYTIDDYSALGAPDRLKFTNLASTEASFDLSGTTDIKVTLTNGEVITLLSQLDTSGQFGVADIEFSDGVIKTRADLFAVLDPNAPGQIYGTSGDDDMTGTAKADYFNGGAGNDIYHVEFGRGNDRAREGWNFQNDRAIFANGVTLSDIVATATDVDGNGVLDFTLSINGIIGSFTLEEVFRQDSWAHDLQIDFYEFSDGTVLTHEEFFAATYYKGTDQDDTLWGTINDDTFTGSLGNDTYRADKGNDIINVDLGQGDNIVWDGWNYQNDRMIFAAGISLTNIVTTAEDVDGNGLLDLKIGFDNGTGSMSVSEVFRQDSWAHDRQIDFYEFADGTVLTHEEFFAATYYSGTSGDDTLWGTINDDTFTGSLGNDTYRADKGNDVVHVGLDQGDNIVWDGWNYQNDRIVFDTGITLADIVGSAEDVDGNGLLDFKISFSNGSGSMAISEAFRMDSWAHDRQIDWYEFADGTVLSHEAFFSAVYHNGTTANDVLHGTLNNDVFTGSLGDDTYHAGKGHDTIHVGLNQGDNIVWDSWNYQNDRIVFEAGISLSDIQTTAEDVDGNGILDFKISFSNGSGSITVSEAFWMHHWAHDRQIDFYEFSDGTVLTHEEFFNSTYYTGTAGNDILEGTLQTDVFTGGLGDDLFRGGFGNDTYMVTFGNGDDRAHEWGNYQNDRVIFGTGITLNDLTGAKTDTDGNGYLDLTITHSTLGGSFTVEEVYRTESWAHDRQIDWYEFADGTILSHEEMFNALNVV